MPYRKVYIGDGETVVARVPKEVIDEWLENRERNRNLGYPDRPPDVDTELMRSWVAHPDEKEWVESMMSRMNRKEKELAFPVFTVATQLDLLEAKFLIEYTDTTGYNYRLVCRNLYSGEPVIDKETRTEEWDELLFESILELYHDLFVKDNDNGLMITTYCDYIALEEEFDLVYKELEDFYGVDFTYPAKTIGTE